MHVDLCLQKSTVYSGPNGIETISNSSEVPAAHESKTDLSMSYGIREGYGIESSSKMGSVVVESEPGLAPSLSTE